MDDNNEESDICSSGESESSQTDSDVENDFCNIDCNDVDYVHEHEIFYNRYYHPSIKMFTSKTGLRENIPLKGNEPVHYFKLIFSDSFLDMICKETNRYQNQNPEEKSANMKAWEDLKIDEFFKFLALSILMGCVRKGSLKDYWSTNPILVTPIFPQVMSRNRYFQILRFLHFHNNERYTNHPLNKIKSVIDHMNKIFASVWDPGKKLCVDESFVSQRGKSGFKQFLDLKRSRIRKKIFKIFDCDTGFILQFIIYTGSSIDYKKFGLGKSGDIVAHFLNPYFLKGHIVYVSNQYSSPALAEFLHEKETGLCGKVRKDRIGLPEFKATLKRGEVEVAHNMIWMAIKWQDKKKIYMITTVHELEFKQIEKKSKYNEDIIKPICIIDYNKNIGKINNIYKQLFVTDSMRKCLKWYKKIFFYLVDLALINAYALYNANNKKLSFPDFRLTIVSGLLNLEDASNVTIQPGPNRLFGKHFPVQSEKKKRCVLCQMTKKRSESRMKCNVCLVSLCITPCFYIYHSKSQLP